MSARTVHAKLVKECTVIAAAVSQTSSGAAHTVQLMLRDPEFREKAISEAQSRVSTHHLSAPTGAQVVAEQDVRSAAYQLRRYAGRKL